MRIAALTCITVNLAMLTVACTSEDSSDDMQATEVSSPTGGTGQASTGPSQSAPAGPGSSASSPSQPIASADPTASPPGSIVVGPGTMTATATGSSPSPPSTAVTSTESSSSGGQPPTAPSPVGDGGKGGVGGDPSIDSAGAPGTDAGGMPAVAEPRCPTEQTEATKSVVRDGITTVFINGNSGAIDDYWADPYIQHNPLASSGVSTFKSFFSNVSPGFYSLTRLIGECDKVLIHGSYQQSGPTFDMLRVDPDKQRMVEHWDAAISGSPGAHPFLDGPTEVADLELTEANRAVVLGFVNDVMIDGNTENASTYLNAELIEHAAGGMDGADAFVQRAQSDQVSYSTIHHQIAEGNFVFTLSEGEAGGSPFGFWDLFRVADAMIVEHWSARLAVQAGASGEGIF